MSAIWEKWRPVVEGKKFLWLQVPPWDNVWTRQNQFVLRLASLGAEVLYVEFINSWLKSIRSGSWEKVPFFRGANVREITPGLQVMQLPTQFPGSMHSDTVANINGRLAARAVKSWMSDQEWGSYYCWCRVPVAKFTLEYLEPKAIIYDITDDYGHFVSNEHVKRRVYKRENILLDKVNQVFVTADKLLEKGNLNGRKVDVIPNGVDYELFSKVTDDDLPVHPDVGTGDKPLIGFVGLTNSWMDFELLEMLGKKWPGQIIMVGPVDRNYEHRAKSIPGLVWKGFVKDRADLPGYMKGFDVLIIPFLVNELTSNMNPLKTWEYLATGKPVVSVDLPALSSLKSVFDIVDSREAFMSVLEQRLQGEEAGRQEARQAIARQYTWDGIFDRMMGVFSQYLK